MASFFKTLKKKFKRNNLTIGKDRLLTEHEEPGTQICHYFNVTDQLNGDPGAYSYHSGSNEETIISILRGVLKGEMSDCELEEASKQLKKWVRQNGGNFSQDCKKEYFKLVEQFLDNNFPTVPEESQRVIEEFLESARSFMFKKLMGLVLVLEEEGLMSLLLDSFNHRLFATLDVLLDRTSSVKDALSLLLWVKVTYFRQDCKGCSNTESRTFGLSDPLLLTEWFEKSKQKLLTLLPDYISTCLQEILQYVDHDCSSDEAFMRIQIDVIKFTNATIQGNKEVSQTLGSAVQKLCCDELHSFAKKYEKAEQNHFNSKSKITNLLHLCKTVHTCGKLRSYAESIIESNNNINSMTILLFENLEKQALTIAQEWFTTIAKDCLKKYFNNNDDWIHNLIDTIQGSLEAVGQVEAAKETEQCIVNVAYQNVTRAYLHCLTKKKYKKLEKRWRDVEKRIMRDAELFHSCFTQPNGSDTQKMLLLKLNEIVHCTDIDSVKLSCSVLYKEFPKESEEYLHVLLHWRGRWSNGQIREVLNMVWDSIHNGEQVRPHPWMYWNCGLCCT